MSKQLKRPQACREKTSYFLFSLVLEVQLTGNGRSFKQAAKKNGIALRLLHAIYSLPLAESLPLHRVE